MKIGDRVYHRKLRANGYIKAIDEDKKRDKYLVEFFWARYCDIPHGSHIGPERKWMYCSDEHLLVQQIYVADHEGNAVSTVGDRSLDKLIRKVCELPRRRHNDGSDIIINYGVGVQAPPSIFVINRRLQGNKYLQCLALQDLAPEVKNCLYEPIVDSNWIVKPFHSIGGRDIFEYDSPQGGRVTSDTHYMQRKMDKVREFRAHVFLWADNKVPIISEKYIEDKSQLCWNKKQGGEFKYPYQPKLGRRKMLREDSVLVSHIMEMAIDACKTIRYDMGGVDLGMDAEGNLKVFEVNSRMGLREQTFATYKDVFWQLKALDIEKYKEERW